LVDWCCGRLQWLNFASNRHLSYPHLLLEASSKTCRTVEIVSDTTSCQYAGGHGGWRHLSISAAHIPAAQTVARIHLLVVVHQPKPAQPLLPIHLCHTTHEEDIGTTKQVSGLHLRNIPAQVIGLDFGYCMVRLLTSSKRSRPADKHSAAAFILVLQRSIRFDRREYAQTF
jgi:hypothetical protein